MLFKAVIFLSLVRQPAEQIPRHHFHDQRLRAQGHGDQQRHRRSQGVHLRDSIRLHGAPLRPRRRGFGRRREG